MCVYAFRHVHPLCRFAFSSGAQQTAIKQRGWGPCCMCMARGKGRERGMKERRSMCMHFHFGGCLSLEPSAHVEIFSAALKQLCTDTNTAVYICTTQLRLISDGSDFISYSFYCHRWCSRRPAKSPARTHAYCFRCRMTIFLWGNRCADCILRQGVSTV